MNISCRRTSVIGGGGLVARLCPTLVTSWTVAHLAPLSMGLSRQEYWSWLPFPSPGDLPDFRQPPVLHCRQILYRLSHQRSRELSKTHCYINGFILHNCNFRADSPKGPHF